MYIYNVTIKVTPQIEEDWLRWMQETHLNEVIATGQFDSYHLSELIEPKDDEGSTYVAQYYTDSKQRYETYIEEFAPALREKGYQLFGDQFIAFRSILQQII